MCRIAHHFEVSYFVEGKQQAVTSWPHGPCRDLPRYAAFERVNLPPFSGAFTLGKQVWMMPKCAKKQNLCLEHCKKQTSRKAEIIYFTSIFTIVCKRVGVISRIYVLCNNIIKSSVKKHVALDTVTLDKCNRCLLVCGCECLFWWRTL